MNPHLPSLARLLSCFLMIGSLVPASHAANLHVSPTGKDSNPGTPTAPLLTLAAARDAARNLAGKESVTVHVADGVYYLPETLVFTPADSGTAKFPVVYEAANEGKAVLSGGVKLDLKWESHGKGIFKALTPAGIVFDQVFIDGNRQRMARYPNFDPAKTTSAYQGFSAAAISKERVAGWADPTGGFIHAMHSVRWGGYHYRITGKKPDGNVAYEGGWQNNRKMGMHKHFRMVENIFEELDASGEWFHDAKTNTLYYLPEPGTDLSKSIVEVVRLQHLVEFQGEIKSPVKHVTLKGFTFRHTARTFMDTKEPLLRSDWTIYRGGAVLLTGTENLSILDCEFDQVGGNAIFVNNYNRRALIKGCHIHDAGASGVCFVGDPDAVREPLFDYNKSKDLTKIDRIPGPKTENFPAESIVEDCLIHGIGRIERQPAGVQISMSYMITVRDTSIYDCARSGINISEGTWGGHLIDQCDVFDTVLETSDHGSFNSWGRDRFWNRNRGVSGQEVKKDPKLPYLDAMKTTVISNSRWRCDHGWDIDLDDGSSNYEIYNNLMLAGGLKFREGYGRKAYNNILVNSGFHPHAWFDDSASAFQRNIVMRAHAPTRQPEGWGKLLDRNLFMTEADRTKNLSSGGDANSLVGDPKFLDPTKGDFRVAEDSPALTLGFKNFPMDQFGVKKPSLKAIAKFPAIPQLANTKNSASDPSTTRTFESSQKYWLGASLSELEGEAYSAFGVSKEDGGVQLVKVPTASAAAQAGLFEDDLVQKINDRKVSNLDHVFAALNAAESKPLKLYIIRDQKSVEITLTSTPFIATETTNDPNGFTKLTPSPSSGVAYTAKTVVNGRLESLTDGVVTEGYGPVFANGTHSGIYKTDLGKAQPITSVNSWSFNQNGKRGRQLVNLFGSNCETDPGWDTNDTVKYIPIGTIDSASLPTTNFTATSLRAPSGKTLGTYRWIMWETFPVTHSAENTAWQEFSIETAK